MTPAVGVGKAQPLPQEALLGGEDTGVSLGIRPCPVTSGRDNRAGGGRGITSKHAPTCSFLPSSLGSNQRDCGFQARPQAKGSTCITLLTLGVKFFPLFSALH